MFAPDYVAPEMHEVIGEIDNWDRAMMAKTTVEQFAVAYYHSEGDQDLDDEETREMVVSDFLCDLLHWLDPETVERLLERGAGHYHEEIAEEEGDESEQEVRD